MIQKRSARIALRRGCPRPGYYAAVTRAASLIFLFPDEKTEYYTSAATNTAEPTGGSSIFSIPFLTSYFMEPALYPSS